MQSLSEIKFFLLHIIRQWIFFFLGIVYPVLCLSQNPSGSPFIKNYSPKQYSAATDNWAIAQSRNGIMFFGNAAGVLQYDGINWKLIPVNNTSLVRSLAIDINGIIYVGAVGEMGYLAPNKNGALVYHSLLNRLPENERDFADVWKTFATPEGIYFHTFTKLIRLSKDGIKIWKPETSFHFCFNVNNKIFVNERERGLKQITGDSLESVSQGAFFSGLRIYSMLPYSEGKILIATREKGLFLMNEKGNQNDSSIRFFPGAINSMLINAQVYGGTRLTNGRYAFATLLGGIFITDSKGNILQTLNKLCGLQDDNAKFLFTDHQDDLWIALGNGISRAELSSPLTFMNDAHGLKGSIESIVKNKNALYAATSLGVYKSINTYFLPVEGIASQTWSLLNFVLEKDTLLLASSEAGLYLINDLKAKFIHENYGYIIYQSRAKPERLFIGLNDGLYSLRYAKGKWIDEGYLKGIEKEIRSIAEDSNGDLWLGTKIEGLIKIHFFDESNNKSVTDTLISSWMQSYTISEYNTDHGLPGIQDVIPNNYLNRILFGTDKGLYEFDAAKDRFVRSGFLENQFKSSQVYRFVPKDSTTTWLFTVLSETKETGYAQLQPDHSLKWHSKPFGKISDREIHAIFPDQNNITWLGGPEGLLRYDGNVKKDFSQKFYAHICKVLIGKDSIVFDGFYYKTDDSLNLTIITQPGFLKPSVNYSLNNFTFEYSATSYGDEQNNLFNVYLEGFDEGWSGWSSKTLKEYTSLKEGEYTFHVKSKNIYGTESIESTYEFKILPPWYRTIFAYIMYVIAFIFFVYLMIQLSIRRLKQAKTQLEKTVKERTAEVVKQKEEIESQKLLVESKNKDITDSINYAQRIQRSLLASDKLLSTYLKDYFIYFQPKDIVSGDFYWASELHDGNLAFVTADSTGHGVPGAIMSMLNISCLNEAINGNKLTAPNEILNFTRKKIIGHLSNDGSAEGGKDGMDCSIVCFDFKQLQIKLAAANNPVWIVRNKEIIEFAPDKMPVGKHDNDTISFSEQVFQLIKGDVVYTLTDGMPDQFGGPKGKKFMYKQLKELLISISDKEMKEQKEILSSKLNVWKGELEQIDDICLVGVRI
jgi:serine phosphatase RsbU (regulator of sigma subunit)/ligand-binding sensor domain-containing protein